MENVSKFQKQGTVKEIKGNVLNPELSALSFIVNFCSESGKYDQKLDKLISSKWMKVKQDVYEWFATSRTTYKLGAIKETPTASNIWAINLLVRDKNGVVDTKALTTAVKNITAFAKKENATLHISQLLTDEVETFKTMLLETAVKNGVNVFFYAAQ